MFNRFYAVLPFIDSSDFFFSNYLLFLEKAEIIAVQQTSWVGFSFLSGGLYEHGDNAYSVVFQQSSFRQNKCILTAGQEEGDGTGLSVKLRGFAAPLVAPFLLVGIGG